MVKITFTTVPRRTYANKVIEHSAPTFAARGSIVGVSRWAVATCSAARRVGTFTFAVAAAVVFQALVHV